MPTWPSDRRRRISPRPLFHAWALTEESDRKTLFTGPRAPQYVSTAFLAGISTPAAQKPHFWGLFGRFFLAFPVFLGYIPSRPEYFTQNLRGSRLGACFDRIEARPDPVGMESKIRRIRTRCPSH